MDWPTKPIGELCDLINGKAFKPSDWEQEGLPIVRIQNLNDSSKPYNHFSGPYAERHHIDDGDILLSWSGTPGTSFGCFRWQRGPALLNQHIFKVLVDSAQMDGDFFIHAVNSRLDEMIRQAHGGVGLRHITKAKLNAIHLPVPELDEQRRVAARIQECMERIDEIEELSATRQEETKALVPATLEDVFLNNGSDEVKLFSMLTEKPRNGCYLPKDHYVTEGGVPIVRMGEMFRRFEVKEHVEKQVLPDEKLMASHGLREGDVLVARRSIVYEGSGTMALVTAQNSGSLFESSIIRLRFDTTRVLPAFVVAFFHSREGVRRRMEITKKSTISGVNQQGLRRLLIPLPDLDAQTSVLDRVAAIRQAHCEMVETIPATEIGALRDSILRKAFAGEL